MSAKTGQPEEDDVRSSLLAAAVVVVGLAAGAPSALTAGNDVPASTAVYRATTVTGAQLVSLDYTITAGTVTTVTARLQKTDLLTTTLVTAAFGADDAVSCVGGLITIVDVTLNLGQADYTCTGFTERADRPRGLSVNAS